MCILREINTRYTLYGEEDQTKCHKDDNHCNFQFHGGVYVCWRRGKKVLLVTFTIGLKI